MTKKIIVCRILNVVSLFAYQTRIQDMGHTSDEIVVCKLEDQEQDGVLAVPLPDGTAVTQAHPGQQQHTHGFRKQLGGQLLRGRQIRDVLDVPHLKALHLLADAAVCSIETVAQPPSNGAEQRAAVYRAWVHGSLSLWL